jgi:Rha family phage regulatory protein
MELTIIKKNGGAYIDSREVAEIIGKDHRNLLRDIRGYAEILRKRGALNFELSDFFVESAYLSAQNKSMPCYLLTKAGCEMVATKLTGEKGVLFSFAYVKEFNRMEQAERERFAKQANTPTLAVFNTAVRNVLGGMSYSDASPKAVMDFLRGAYKPFGITVSESGDSNRYFSASVIACALRVYSNSGRPHSHAISAIIEKLNFDTAEHIEVVPYGLVGFSMRYDEYVAQSVADWIELRGYPRTIPHNGIEYHVHYKEPFCLCKYDFDSGISAEIDLDDDFYDDFWGDE